MDIKKLASDDLDQVIGGVTYPAKRQKYVSAYYCPICGRTEHLNGVYTPERAKAEHDRKYHPGAKK